MRIIAVLLCLVLPLAAHTQTAEQPTGTIALSDNASADAAIANRIRDILGELDGYDDISVTVSSGIVTLRGTTLDPGKADRLNELASRIEGVVAIENTVQESTDVVERLNPAMDRFRTRATQLIAFLPLALVALSVFALVVVFGFWLARRKQPWDRLSPNAFIADIYRQITRLLFVIGGLVIALDIVNATALLSGILGAAGIAGLAIGFAVRDTVENFIASIMLSIRQPFRPNDTVEIEGDTGKVIRLTSRATILLSFDGNHIRIPNATVFKSRIVNYSRNAERRFTFALSVASDADLDHARTLALEVLNRLPFVLSEPEASVWVESVDDFWITLSMAAWINQNETNITLARSEAIRLTQAAFDADAIAAPVPSYRIENLPVETQDIDKKQLTESHKQPQTPAPVQEVAATQDQELEKIVDQERAELSRHDLLSDTASEE
ncbi:mechanosensitive ion channel [Sulfitobacter sp. M57]|uniref:mechanosensitive ion channel domain-containing protein n=1 Tax=unclassified Sulfitobacter TaxID=196795 RepID=UPI0023E0CCC8|nr:MULTISPECIES: mechanosensitive ion channel domain-containing protein [unclassified Sulfitobacter]MDF3415829.1 mechanosensitive ion channel [Sulfitobacter sp. KE5]MDF3423309.1 mechanosensitive ion channel [Sulfitobacter sp. KE43]MDF3434375.1 mechanosensitive ion channel [Sulfitobacter sp. KE42]MDF3460015.1 mechanosensitive ion channel [Sulfitobacter sp. S74]MDF3463913.1 mechanosensitive ion channel [Sulfitobacter sp. Ks18]